MTTDEYRAFVGGATSSLSGMVHVLDVLVAEDDTLACHMSISGKHTGDFQGAAPTGKTAFWTATATWRFNDGKVVEMWVDIDLLGLMQQLGAVSAPAAAS